MTVAELDALCADLQSKARTATTVEEEAEALAELRVAVAAYREAVRKEGLP